MREKTLGNKLEVMKLETMTLIENLGILSLTLDSQSKTPFSLKFQLSDLTTSPSNKPFRNYKTTKSNLEEKSPTLKDTKKT